MHIKLSRNLPTSDWLYSNWSQKTYNAKRYGYNGDRSVLQMKTPFQHLVPSYQNLLSSMSLYEQNFGSRGFGLIQAFWKCKRSPSQLLYSLSGWRIRLNLPFPCHQQVMLVLMPPGALLQGGLVALLDFITIAVAIIFQHQVPTESCLTLKTWP